MSITRWNPTRDLLSISDEMNRLVNSVFSNDNARETSLYRGTWNPAVDISEDDNNFYLHVDLPGLTREDVKVKYDEGTLAITGERKSGSEEKNINYHRVERVSGKFERSFRITSRVLPEKIAADFQNGVLSITLPKAEEVKPREIEVKVK